MRTILPLVIAGAVAIAACGRDNAPPPDRALRTAPPSAPQTAVAFAPDSLTASERGLFGALPVAFAANGVRPNRAEVDLGRMLYYDNLLSGGHDVSCNSCHPLNAYGADGRPVSYGDAGHTGSRNSPTVYNAAGQAHQFWDGRAASVEEQAKGPILNPAEMAMPEPAAVLEHLQALPAYRAAFHAAFPGEPNPITYDNVGRAIGAFERGLVTPARWDRLLTGDRSALSRQEVRGAREFVANGCAACHNGVLVGGGSLQPLGRARQWPVRADSGRFAVTGNPADLYVFKVPTLRNVAQTGPYFHDGSVSSLDEAIRLMARHQVGRELSAQQVADIHAWLASLTGELPRAYIAQPQLPAQQQ
jgi:cytochrome c peroxidase